MFKIVSTAAMAILLASTAMAATPVFKFTGGQFSGTTQYTGLIDPNNICGSVAGLAAGQLTSSVSTISGLGVPWTSTITNTNPAGAGAPAFGVGWIECSFAALPAASTFVATNIGTASAPVYEFVSTPTAAQTTSCQASTGTAYTLTSGNGSISSLLFNGGAGTPETETQGLTITGLPAVTGGKDSGFRLTSTNSVLASGAFGAICFLSTDAVYLNTSK